MTPDGAWKGGPQVPTDTGPTPSPQARAAGLTLVILQFAVLMVLAAIGFASRPEQPIGLLAPALWAAGGVLGAAALWANPPGNFNIRPDPHPTGHLVTHGIYRWVRHPMYAALLVVACGVAAAAAPGLRLAAWGALLGLLVILTLKSILEERWLAQRHPEYLDYALQTRRFLPGRF